MAADLAVITPSRSRPEQLRRLLDAVERLSALDVELRIGLDDDDPMIAEYSRVFDDHSDVIFDVGPRRSLSAWTNDLAMEALTTSPRYLASLGDDHVPRTSAWDEILIDRIENNLLGPGFAYGNDLLQGGALPTAWVVSADVVRTLGWMMLPGCAHMYVDVAVRELGQVADRIWYEPTVIIEHAHPMAGKTAWDMSYRESNAPERYNEDRIAFEAWQDGRLEIDAATLRAMKY